MTTTTQPGTEPGTSHFPDDIFACLQDRAAWLGGYTSTHNSLVTSKTMNSSICLPIQIHPARFHALISLFHERHPVFFNI